MMRLPVLGMATILLMGAAPAALRLGVSNQTGSPLECHALTGHWYGFDLGVIAPGGHAEWTLLVDAATGTLSLPNSLHQPIPLQNIYCGRTQEAWQTRAELALRRLAAARGQVEVTCRVDADRMNCE